MDAANLLKPMLARGELRCIGATTLAEYRKYVEKDAAFERRLQQVQAGMLLRDPSLTLIRYVPEAVWDAMLGVTNRCWRCANL